MEVSRLEESTQLYKDRGKETNVQGQSELYKCMMTEVMVLFYKDRGNATIVQGQREVYKCTRTEQIV